MKTYSVTRRRLRIALPMLLIACAAFGKPPVPTSNLEAAKQAIANAERVDGATLAGLDLGEARAKLASAEQAVQKKEMIEGAQYADEARVSAELSAAKAGAVKAKAVNADIKRATASLVEEMQRKTGDNK